jgi:hypothetical protein
LVLVVAVVSRDSCAGGSISNNVDGLVVAVAVTVVVAIVGAVATVIVVVILAVIVVVVAAAVLEVSKTIPYVRRRGSRII